MTDETDIEMVTRHVSLGIATVIRQKRIIATLRAAECPAEALELAEQLLGTFWDMQKQHEAHLKLLLAQEAARRPATASSRAGILDYQIENLIHISAAIRRGPRVSPPPSNRAAKLAPDRSHVRAATDAIFAAGANYLQGLPNRPEI